MRAIPLFVLSILCVGSSLPALAQDFPYNRNASLQVGQSIVLKGVRSADCSLTEAPSWKRVSSQLPQTKLGRFSDGGVGTVNSNQCKGRVAARAVRFTATHAGQEQFTILEDSFTIAVR